MLLKTPPIIKEKQALDDNIKINKLFPFAQNISDLKYCKTKRNI